MSRVSTIAATVSEFQILLLLLLLSFIFNLVYEVTGATQITINDSHANMKYVRDNHKNFKVRKHTAYAFTPAHKHKQYV